jgi:hypothetical protein
VRRHAAALTCLALAAPASASAATVSLQDGHFVYAGEASDDADLTYVRLYDGGPDDTGGVPACGAERPIVCVQSSAGVIPVGTARPPTPGPGCRLTQFGLAQLAACPGPVADLRIAAGDAPHPHEFGVAASRRPVVVAGGPGDEKLHIAGSDVQATGGGGNDTIDVAANGPAFLDGGTGDDALGTSPGLGDAGALRVVGGPGNDRVGAAGRDGHRVASIDLDGGPGDDAVGETLYSDPPPTRATGGEGNDSFSFFPATSHVRFSPSFAAELSCGPGRDGLRVSRMGSAPRPRRGWNLLAVSPFARFDPRECPPVPLVIGGVVGVRLPRNRTLHMPLRFNESVRVRLRLRTVLFKRHEQVFSTRLRTGRGRLTVRLDRTTVALLRRTGRARPHADLFPGYGCVAFGLRAVDRQGEQYGGDGVGDSADFCVRVR